MVLNVEKHTYMFKHLLSKGWGVYQRHPSSVYWWVDPFPPNKDFRLKVAYTRQRAREID